MMNERPIQPNNMDRFRPIQSKIGLFRFLLVASLWGFANLSDTLAQNPLKRPPSKQDEVKTSPNGPKKMLVTPRQSRPSIREMAPPSSRRDPNRMSEENRRDDSHGVLRANFQTAENDQQPPHSTLEGRSNQDDPAFGPAPFGMEPDSNLPNLNRNGTYGNDPMPIERPIPFPVRQHDQPNLDETNGRPSGEHPDNNARYKQSLSGSHTQSGSPQDNAGLQFQDGQGQAFGGQTFGGQAFGGQALGGQAYGNGQGHLHDGANLYGSRLGHQQPFASERALELQREKLKLDQEIRQLKGEAEIRRHQLETAQATIRRQQEELNIALNRNKDLMNQAASLANERDAAIKLRENSERQFNEQLKGIETMLDSALMTELTDKK